MKAIARNCALLFLGVSLLFLSACGTTAVIESHPSLARPGDNDAAKVYFLRPDIGYHGVMRNAFSISLNDNGLLTLANDEYALVYLKPVSGVVTVESSTVKYENGRNVQTKVKESRRFSFDAGKTYYLAFQASLPGQMTSSDILESVSAMAKGPSFGGTSYAPILITRSAAIAAANRTKPIGLALQEPITQSK